MQCDSSQSYVSAGTHAGAVGLMIRCTDVAETSDVRRWGRTHRLCCVSAREKLGVQKIGVQGAASLVQAGVCVEWLALSNIWLTRALVHELRSMRPELEQRLATLKQQNGKEISSYSSRMGYQSSPFLASEKCFDPSRISRDSFLSVSGIRCRRKVFKGKDSTINCSRVYMIGSGSSSSDADVKT